MSHTPGPWYWNGVATIWNTKGHAGEVEREVIVAEVVCDYGNNTHVEPIPVREANARLIAAAPDLLEACQRIELAISREFWTSDDGETQREGTPEDGAPNKSFAEDWKAVLSAIAKATGAVSPDPKRPE